MRGKSLMDKGLANTFAVLIGVYKKRFQMPFVQEHEAERRVRAIDGDQQGPLREKAQNLSLDGVAVVWSKKVVGGVNSSAPDVHDTRQIGRGGGTKI